MPVLVDTSVSKVAIPNSVAQSSSEVIAKVVESVCYSRLAEGDDAPKPIPGATVAYDVDDNLANWAKKMVRVPASVKMDGYGSVSVHDSAMYANVPYFWGLPFAEGSIVEQAMVEASTATMAWRQGRGRGRGRGRVRVQTSACQWC